MRHALKLHPDSSCAALTGVTVEVSRPRPGALVLDYAMTGDICRLRIPAPARRARADGLWRRTCFEAFLRAPGEAAYCEFNFAPSSEWAAYRFDRRREGMAELAMADPLIEMCYRPESLTLLAPLELDAVPGLPPYLPWRLGLSAVVEDLDGGLSYWALAHPPGPPDFHHPDCFALEVVAPGGS